MGIIIGLGTGRSGTSSLSNLISSQPNSVCFHEINPSSMKWQGYRAPVLSLISEFRCILDGGPRDLLTIDFSVPNRDVPLERLHQVEQIDFIGEIGFYYLNYVEEILAQDQTVKFPCIRRDMAETVDSYFSKMFSNKYISKTQTLFNKKDSQRNHFMEHDGQTWLKDPVWDKCYPKYETQDMKEAIAMYWRDYYKQAQSLADSFPQVRIFDLQDLNDRNKQMDLLKFCGYQSAEFAQHHTNKKISR